MLIIVTSAELEIQKEMRTSEYLNTLQWLKENAQKHKIVWLECVKDNISYVENNFEVYYSNCNNPNYSNKGANLGLSLKTFFENYEVEEDIVVQMTGRYNFLSRHFFDTIENNLGYDFYGVQKIEYQQCFTGCFGMRKKYFKDWLYQTDWEDLNRTTTNIEKSLWDYNAKNQLNCMYLDKVDVRANIFGDGGCQVVYF